MIPVSEWMCGDDKVAFHWPKDSRLSPNFSHSEEKIKFFYKMDFKWSEMPKNESKKNEKNMEKNEKIKK